MGLCKSSEDQDEIEHCPLMDGSVMLLMSPCRTWPKAYRKSLDWLDPTLDMVYSTEYLWTRRTYCSGHERNKKFVTDCPQILAKGI
jgi:hypothetical protein